MSGSTFQGKPHITRRDGQTIIEFRIADAEFERAGVTNFPASPRGWSSLGWFPSETFAGAWQRNVLPRKQHDVLAFSAVYACVSLIAGDISKLRLMLTERQDDGTWLELDPTSPLVKIFRTPNAYQTWAQFASEWVTSKLIHGNAYVLLERDNRGPGALDGVVSAWYVLNPHCVTPLVAESGDVFYQLRGDYLAGIGGEVIVAPASEIIHDRMPTFWHPLVGVSPIYACGRSALQGIAIQENSDEFFSNMSMPSGVLSAPKAISDETAKRLDKQWNEKFGSGGTRRGGIAVLGDGLKYEAMSIPAGDAQLIEQLRWTVEDVARCFHVPPYKLGLQTNVTFSNAAQLDQDYYKQCLQKLLESFEQVVDKALALPYFRRTEFDTEAGLMRMDPLGQAEADKAAISGSIMAPNEARIKRNLSPKKGGDSPMAQQQNYSLEALAKRDAQADPFASKAPPAPAQPPQAAPTADQVARAVVDSILPATTEIVRRAADEPLRRLEEKFDRGVADLNAKFCATNDNDAGATELAQVLITRFAAASVDG